MPRKRRPEREQAYKLWRESSGKRLLKDIAAELGVTDNQVRKWKSQDNWEGKKKGNVTKTKKKNVPKKKSNIPEQISPAVEAVFSAPNNEELTERQQLFCRFFVNNKNATQAAIKAGYSSKTAMEQGYQLLQKPSIRAEIERLKAIRNQAIMLSEDDIVERQMRIAFADMSDFAEWGTEDVMDLDEAGNIRRDSEGKIRVLKRDYLDFKSSNQIDGGLVCEISLGKSGMKVKLKDSQKAMDWLTDYFEMNPMSRHKKWYDREKLKMDKESLNHRKEMDAKNNW